MTTRRISGLTAAVMVLVAAPTLGQQRSHPDVPVMGQYLQLWIDGGERLFGELISVGEGRALLLTGTGHVEVELDQVRESKVQRHKFTSGKAWTWVGIGALVSGLGLTAACSSVEDTSCGGVFPVVALSWGVVGGLLALTLGRSAWEEIPAQGPPLRPYARFPQGLPSGYIRQQR